MDSGLAAVLTCRRPQFLHSRSARTVCFVASEEMGAKLVRHGGFAWYERFEMGV